MESYAVVFSEKGAESSKGSQRKVQQGKCVALFTLGVALLCCFTFSLLLFFLTHMFVLFK